MGGPQPASSKWGETTTILSQVEGVDLPPEFRVVHGGSVTGWRRSSRAGSRGLVG